MMLGCGDKTPPPLPLPPPATVDDPGRGLHIQRTMRALAESTADRPNTVKVLFYGQSISREPWTGAVAESLRQRYPSANLVVENRAIGGFVADLLVRTARADIATFHPDLIIIHDLFDMIPHLDRLINELVSLSTAEIMLQTTHRRGEGFKATRWDARCSDEYRRVAAEHGLQLVDIRAAWERFLSDHGLHPLALLRDEAGHLNPAGNALMAALIERELVYLPTHPREAKGNSEPAPVAFDDAGRASVSFVGNRIEADVVAAPGAAADGTAPLRVLIDGVAPSTLASAWVHGRVGSALCSDWPWDCSATILVSHRVPLVDEEWKLLLHHVSPDGVSFSFDLIGSVTGKDGSGIASEDFVSTSGRVAIEARDWWLARAIAIRPKARLPDKVQMTWRPSRLHSDVVRAAAGKTRVVLVGGIDNAQHTLTLERAGDGPLPAVTVQSYRPAR